MSFHANCNRLAIDLLYALCCNNAVLLSNEDAQTNRTPCLLESENYRKLMHVCTNLTSTFVEDLHGSPGEPSQKSLWTLDHLLWRNTTLHVAK